jgi:hypothetical protein
MILVIIVIKSPHRAYLLVSNCNMLTFLRLIFTLYIEYIVFKTVKHLIKRKLIQMP